MLRGVIVEQERHQFLWNKQGGASNVKLGGGRKTMKEGKVKKEPTPQHTESQ